MEYQPEEYGGLPNEMVEQICMNLDDKSLIEFATRSKKTYAICEKEIKRREKLKNPLKPIPGFSPFSTLYPDQIYEICENMDNQTLSKLMQSDIRIYDICRGILEHRRRRN